MKENPFSVPEKKPRLDALALWAGISVTAILVLVFLFQYLVSTPTFQTKSNLEWYRRLLYFDYMFLLFASGTAIIIGAGLLFLGYGRSKIIGSVFLLGGIATGLAGLFYFGYIFDRPRLPSNVYESLTVVVATIAGLLIALVMAFIVIVVSRKTSET